MPIAKHCAARGCQDYPMYGFGSGLKGTMRWACAAHRGLIGCKVEIATGIGGAASGSRSAGAREDGAREGAGRPPEAPRPAQGRLFG